MADHKADPQPIGCEVAKSLASQTPRPEMLLFVFEGDLFQFDVREPEFTVLFQLPPRITADPLTPSLHLYDERSKNLGLRQSRLA